MRSNQLPRSVVSALCAVSAIFVPSELRGQIRNESLKLLPSDGASGERFGAAAALCGDAAIVGTWRDRDSLPDKGAAYVFRLRSGDTLSAMQEQKLLASDGVAGDYFGWSVSVSGDVAIVGAVGDDDDGSSSGSAHVFRWTAGPPARWNEEQKLTASDAAAQDFFGSAISITGDVLVVGAWADDDNGDNSGAAYVFRFKPGKPGSWVQEQKLVPSDGVAGDEFGEAVAVYGDTVIVGARDNDDNGPDSGSAYVFRWNGSSWLEEQKLLPEDGATQDFFGASVAISGDVAVVGADFADDGGFDTGTAYVFRFDPAGPPSWREEQKLRVPNRTARDHFGSSVSVSGDLIVVAAAGSKNDALYGAAPVTVFRSNASGWDLELKLSPARWFHGEFGVPVSLSGDIALLGTDGDTENGSGAGAAFLFHRLCMDSDEDGVCDSDDDCPRTGPGIPVDSRGRPLGDFDRDCDNDLVDFQMYQRAVTGPADP